MSIRRTRNALGSLACAAALTIAPGLSEAQAADSLGYTDLRLSFSTMPMDGFSGGPAYNKQSGDFDDAYRISVMAIGPICGILPIGCATPPRLGNSGGASSDSYGGYDDLALEEEFVYYDTGYSYDVLVGFELSGITASADGEVNPLSSLYGTAFTDPFQYQLFFSGLSSSLSPNLYYGFGFGEPEVDFSSVALTFHIGWGFEVATRTSGRWHWEITPFFGAGLADAEWTDGFTGDSDEDEGVYYEVGARIGTYYTFPIGLQIGANVRGIYADADVDFFDSGSNMSMAGITFGLDLGYRF